MIVRIAPARRKGKSVTVEPRRPKPWVISWLGQLENFTPKSCPGSNYDPGSRQDGRLVNSMDAAKEPPWPKYLVEALVEPEVTVDLTLDEEKMELKLSPRGEGGEVALVQYSPQMVEVHVGGAQRASGTKPGIMEEVIEGIQSKRLIDSGKIESSVNPEEISS